MTTNNTNDRTDNDVRTKVLDLLARMQIRTIDELRRAFRLNDEWMVSGVLRELVASGVVETTTVSARIPGTSVRTTTTGYRLVAGGKK